MNLDFSTAVQTAFYLFIFLGVLGIWLGIRTIRSGRKLLFFRKRQEKVSRGWRQIFAALLMVGLAVAINRLAEPLIYPTIYEFFPPSPTVTLTPTESLTPTVTLTPTITVTPSITPTISITPTPFVPTEIYIQFTSSVTANPNAVFSRPQFARELNVKDFQPINPASEFANPINKLYAAFSFNNINIGSQWTAIWVRLADNRIICAETEPWASGTGGYAYSLCQPSADKWQPGEYEFHMFTGTLYKVTARFTVTGSPPTFTPSPTPIVTPTVTKSPTATNTPTASNTPSPLPPTWTPIPSDTRWPSQTPTPATPSPSP